MQRRRTHFAHVIIGKAQVGPQKVALEVTLIETSQIDRPVYRHLKLIQTSQVIRDEHFMALIPSTLGQMSHFRFGLVVVHYLGLLHNRRQRLGADRIFGFYRRAHLRCHSGVCALPALETT